MKKINIDGFKLEQILLPLIMVGVLIASALSFFSYAYYAPTYTKNKAEMQLNLPVIEATGGKIYWAIESGGTLKLSNSQISGVYSGNFSTTSTFNSASLPPWQTYKTIINGLAIINTISPTSTSYWFNNLNIGLSNMHNFENINGSYLTDMSYMFNNATVQSTSYGCLDMADVNAPNLTNTAYMFNGLKCLANQFQPERKIEIENFNHSSISNAVSMFGNMGNVQSIYPGYGFLAEQTGSATNMFYNSTSLCGAHGTCYSTITSLTNQSYAGNKAFARFDNTIYTTSPGYFSLANGDNSLLEYEFSVNLYPTSGGTITPNHFTTYGNSGSGLNIKGFDAKFASSNNNIWSYSLGSSYSLKSACFNAGADDCSGGSSINPFSTSNFMVSLSTRSNNSIQIYLDRNIQQGYCAFISGTSGSWTPGNQYYCNFGTTRSYHLLSDSEGIINLLMDENYTDSNVPLNVQWAATTGATTPNLLNSYIANVKTALGSTSCIINVSAPSFSQIVNASSYAGNSAYVVSSTSVNLTLVTSGYTFATDPKLWLYDYLYFAPLPHNSTSYSSGYWTSDYVVGNSTKAWAVSQGGLMNNSKTADNYGVRPVVQVIQACITNS